MRGDIYPPHARRPVDLTSTRPHPHPPERSTPMRGDQWT